MALYRDKKGRVHNDSRPRWDEEESHYNRMWLGVKRVLLHFKEAEPHLRANMGGPDDDEDNWRNDPTYSLKKGCKNGRR